MNIDNFESVPSPDELQGTLKEAVSLIRTAPPPTESQNRALDRALKWADGLPSPSSPLSPVFPANRKKWSRWFGWTFLGSATALLIALAATLFFQAGNPSTSWAEVAKALQMKTWVRMTDKVKDRGTLWYSQQKQICARSSADSILYCNFNSHFVDRYDPIAKSLIRKSESNSDIEKKEFVDFQNMLESLSAGKAPSFAIFVHNAPLIEQSTTEIERAGRKLKEYRMKYHSEDIRLDRTSTMIIDVDPVTNLPKEMILDYSDKKMGVEGRIEWQEFDLQFDYPTDGPADIYALGVPTSVQRTDLIQNPDLDKK